MGAAASVAAGTPARGGVRLIEAMESAPATVVATVDRPRALRGSGYIATLRIESSVVGEAAAGTKLAVAWEELAASRPTRFSSGDRILVALEPLPGASIWLARLPDDDERNATVSIAMRGDAFLHEPSPASVSLLEHYLALEADERRGPAGTGYLAQLAGGAELPLATNAIERLDARSELSKWVSPPLAKTLVAALVRSDATPEFHAAMLSLVGNHDLAAVQAELEALAAAEGLAPPIVYAALAETDRGLTAEQSARLLAQAPVDYRRIGARTASGEGAEDVLRGFLRSDPDASVRIEAIDRLAAIGGDEAIGPLGDALADPVPAVRAAAARRLGDFGAEAVPELGRVVEGSDVDAARSAVAALMWTACDEGNAILAEIASGHEDESVRALAALALGRPLGHEHGDE